MADITPGYTFSSGETNVTHTKLNNAAAGTINTTFHTGKSAVASNPTPASNELMVYDTGSATFKKGSLATIVFDHTSLLSARTAKTAPVAADAVLIADSAAGNALKQMTVANLLFGAAAMSTDPVAADKLAIYDSAASAIKTITLQNFIDTPDAVSSVDGAEKWMVLTNAGAIRRLSFDTIFANAAAVATVATAETLLMYQGGDLKQCAIGTIVSGASAAGPAFTGAEHLWGANGSTVFKATTQNVKTYCQKGYALYRDEKASSAVGGTLTAGSWQTRTLNTESVDNTIAGSSVASNKVTLAAGTYRFRGRAPFWRVGAAQVRLQNTTDASTVAVGMTVNSANSVNTAVAVAEVTGRFTIAGAKDFELQYQITASVGTSDGGVPGSFGTEVYSTLEFWQED